MFLQDWTYLNVCGICPEFIQARLYVASGNGALSQATSTKFQGIGIFLSDATPMESAGNNRVLTGMVIQNRRRRYGSDSSESGHMQYALPFWQR